MSTTEAARGAHPLGPRDAVELDGGGSTAVVARGRLIDDPSDAAGERPVRDAPLVLPAGTGGRRGPTAADPAPGLRRHAGFVFRSPTADGVRSPASRSPARRACR
ncbi:phosphodiester glycosidase family protein [Streptomyces sp. NPDC018955]|uniref:phosphodiester glycosidase family protein n=1 Tax=Streptomyces sp. NPDC018955 TaxID=3365055 RepID=UPI0037BDD744